MLKYKSGFYTKKGGVMKKIICFICSVFLFVGITACSKDDDKLSNLLGNYSLTVVDINGDLFDNPVDISVGGVVTFTAKVYLNGQDITDTVDENEIKWTTNAGNLDWDGSTITTIQTTTGKRIDTLEFLTSLPAPYYVKAEYNGIVFTVNVNLIPIP